MAGEESLFIGSLLAIAFLIVAFAIFIQAKNNSKRDETMVYRKNVNDLIVVGKLRQFAKKNNVNIEEEMKFFKKFRESERRKEIDDKIEEDIEKDLDKNNKG